MKKNWCALLLAVLLAVTSLPALADNGDLLAEPVELKVWMYGNSDQKDYDEVMEHYNELLSAAVPNTTISIYYPGDYFQEFELAMAAGEQIDLAWSGWGTNFNKLAKDGTLLPMEDLLDAYGQEVLSVIGEEHMISERLFDGHLYQVLTYQGLCGCIFAMYEKQIVDLCHEGWADEMNDLYYYGYFAMEPDVLEKYFALMDEYLGKAQENGILYSGIYPTYFKAYNVPYTFPDTSKGGGNGWHFRLDENGEPYASIDIADESSNSELVYYECIADFYEKGYIIPSILAEGNNRWWTQPENGVRHETDLVTWYTTSSSDMATACQSFADKYGIELVCFSKWPMHCDDLGNATGMSIPYTSKYPERAMMVINEMYKNQDLWLTFVYGLEGKHWQYTEDGMIDVLANNGGAQSTWDYGQNGWVFGNMLLNPASVATLTVDLENCKTAFHRPFMTFNFINDDVADEDANVKAVMTEYQNALQCGVYGDGWKEVYDQYKAELYSAGIEKVAEAADEQLKQFAADKGITEFMPDTEKFPQRDWIVVSPSK